MQNFLTALEKCVETENWYGALFIALTLPDICGKIEYPNINYSSPRYIKWSNKYVMGFYNREHNPLKDKEIASDKESLPDNMENKPFMTGNDLYALRCAYLHEGSNELGGHKIRETLDRFMFKQPPKNHTIHNNRFEIGIGLNSGNSLQIQVSEFSKDIIFAVRQWLCDIQHDQVKMGKINNLAVIDFSPNFAFF